MNARWTVLLAACTAVFLCGALLATAAEPKSGQNQSAMQGSAGIIQTSTLIGTTVLNPQSQKLGRIKDLLLDFQTGQATFVILDAEVSGSGHAMLVVPCQALRVSFNSSENRQSVVLDLRPDQLRARAADSGQPMADAPESAVSGTSPQLLSTQDVHGGASDRQPEHAEHAGRVSRARPSVDPYSGWSQELMDFSSE